MWFLKKSGGVYWGKTTGNMKSSEIEVDDIVSNTDILLVLLLLLIIIIMIMIILMLVLLLLWLIKVIIISNNFNNNVIIIKIIKTKTKSGCELKKYKVAIYVVCLIF